MILLARGLVAQFDVSDVGAEMLGADASEVALGAVILAIPLLLLITYFFGQSRESKPDSKREALTSETDLARAEISTQNAFKRSELSQQQLQAARQTVLRRTESLKLANRRVADLSGALDGLQQESERLRRINAKLRSQGPVDQRRIQLLEVELEQAAGWIAELMDDAANDAGRARTSALEERLAETESALLRSQRELAQTTRVQHETEAELAATRVERDEAVAHFDRLVAELEQTRSDIERLEGLLATAEQERTRLADELAQLTDRMTQMIRRLSELSDEKSTLLQELATARKGRVQGERAARRAHETIAELWVDPEQPLDLRSVEQDAERLDQIAAGRTASVTAMERRIAAVDSAAAVLRKRLDQSAGSARGHQESFQAAQVNLATLERALDGAVTKNAKLSERLLN